MLTRELRHIDESIDMIKFLSQTARKSTGEKAKWCISMIEANCGYIKTCLEGIATLEEIRKLDQ